MMMMMMAGSSNSRFYCSTTMMMMIVVHVFTMLSSCTNTVSAFQTVFTSTAALKNRNLAAHSKTTFTGKFFQKQDASSPSLTQLYAISPQQAAAAIPSLLVSTAATSDSSSDMSSGLLRLFLESLITNGVPALFTIITIGFAAFLFGRSRKNAQQDLLVSSNPVSELYDDLYGDQEQDGDKNAMNFPFFGGGSRGRGSGGMGRPGERRLPKNAGIPKKQYLKIKHLNRQIDSYQYSLTAATKSKAAAAADYRKESFTRAFVDKTLLVSLQDMPASTLQALQEAEAKFLQRATKVVADIQKLQTLLTQVAIDEELQMMGFQSVYDLDPSLPSSENNATAVTDADKKNITAMTTTDKKGMSLARPSSSSGKRMMQNVEKSKSALLQDLSKDQRQLQQLELDFIKSVVLAVGPKHSAAVRTALLGDVAARGSGGLLQALQERRPLASALTLASASSQESPVVDHDSNNDGYSAMAMTGPSPSLFVCRFPGDATASQVANLRNEVTAIVESAKASRQDEVLVILQTGGGTVTGYGLAASQLLRFKEAGLKLTIAVEQVAASGGYMMCCVADKIIASPFAVLGSIGVISDIPNVYERLQREGIEFQTVTAGKYKRTLTPTKKVTKEDFEKSKQDVEEILVLFRDFVAENRPQLDIARVATGETWFGKDALERKLCDEIKPVDSVLLDYVHKGYNVYEVAYSPPREDATSFGGLLPGRGNVEEQRNGLVGKGVRWLVRTIASELEAAATMGGINVDKPIEQRYMAMDDQSDRVKMQ